MDSVNYNDSSGNSATAANRRSPERTRERILGSALAEFSDKGYGGARVDEIARRSGANKRMLYHYFGNKDDLFLAVLEKAYADIREAEGKLNLANMEPLEAMRRLVDFTFTHSFRNPAFIRILNSENLHRARHLRRSTKIQKMHSPLVGTIGLILDRGEEAGVFRKGVDPVQLYVSIAALGYFYCSNIHTLSTIFGRDLNAEEAVDERRRHAIEVILGYLRP